jgi:hypothetical protein
MRFMKTRVDDNDDKDNEDVLKNLNNLYFDDSLQLARE